MRYLRVLILTLSFFALLAPGGRAFAAENGGIGISVEPFLSDLIFEEGETEQPFVITLSNASPGEMTLEASAIDFGSLDATAGAVFLGADRDIEKAYLSADWIVLEAGTIAIPPGESRELRGKLVNTPDLSPGGHYGAVLFRVKEGDALALGPANIAIDQRLSALIFLKKRGGERYGMELSRFGYGRNVFGMVHSAELSFRNEGNVHIAPRGLVEFLDPRGRLVAKGIVNESSSLVLPGIERAFPMALFPVEQAWIPGKYVIRAAVRYDGREDYETREETVFVLPPLFLVPAVGALIVSLGFGIFAFRKRRSGKEQVSQ